MSTLSRILADEELLNRVREVGFDCREDRSRPPQPWEADVNDWLLAAPETRDGALYRTRRKECKAWLFFDEQVNLVGYGSLGYSKWPDPGILDPTLSDLPKVRISLIPSVGIQTPFQGQPKGVPPEQKYSSQIINHLISEARRKMTERQPYLALYVHPQNSRAIKLYERMNFRHFRQTYTDSESGTTYLSMIMKLSF